MLLKFNKVTGESEHSHHHTPFFFSLHLPVVFTVLFMLKVMVANVKPWIKNHFYSGGGGKFHQDISSGGKGKCNCIKKPKLHCLIWPFRTSIKYTKTLSCQIDTEATYSSHSLWVGLPPPPGPGQLFPEMWSTPWGAMAWGHFEVYFCSVKSPIPCKECAK